MTKPETVEYDENRVKAEMTRILPIIAEAAKADRQRNKAGEGISNSLIAIAVECGERGLFTTAVKRAEAFYKLKHKLKRLPLTWTSCKSNIKAMFDKDVPLTDENGVRTFSACIKDLNAERKKENAQAKKDAEAAIPEHEKVLRNILGRILTVGDASLSKDCSDMLEGIYSAYVEKHPEKFEPSDEEVGQESEHAPVAQAA